MTSRDAPADLHDPASLTAADAGSRLPSAALAGAQVRSAAEQLAGLTALDRPRAFVVVGAGATVDAALLIALIGEQAQAPVVGAASLPAWVGPLDVVVVLAAGIDDMIASRAAAVAARRGAAVFVRSSAEGPVADAAGGNLLEPRVSVTESLAGPARLTLLTSVAAAAGLFPRPDFDGVAELLDAMALACHPSSEFFVNPALPLAEHLTAGTPLLIGTDPVADALAGYARRSLGALAGVAACVLTAGEAAASPAVLARTAPPDAAAGVFYDPFEDDGDEPGQRISAVLLSGPSTKATAETSRFSAALDAAVPRAFRIGRDELPEPGAAAPNGPEQAEVEGFASTVLLMSRLDFTAVYAGLATRARPPGDVPDGLGRPGRNAQHVSPAVVPSPWTESEPGSWS